MTNDIAVELTAACKYYPTVDALHPLTMSVKAGEVLGLFGHNGAGKTTLMKIILGVLKPSAGNVSVLGHCPRSNQAHSYRTLFGYLPENVSFYEQLTGREVLHYLAKLKGHSKTQADELLAAVSLTQACDRAVKTYSKGMRQRLGLAQAFLGEPKLLILDEPTVGLDPVATQDFYQTVDRLKSGGCAVILCSHILPGVEQHIDRAMILSKGYKLALGPLDELRSFAKLPIEISVSGMSRSEIEHKLSGVIDDTEWSGEASGEGLVRFTAQTEKKLDILKRLSTSEALQDLHIQLPSLEDLYRFYSTRKQPVGEGINE
ncbi:putative ABC transporter ATP-binding protein NosF [Sinobacterium norvegicum]|uniref:ABC transporter ATP-binding protein NosF n=1 Tax=Sinobacterium norvegicum TaxID=1641715 RepID=A0ABM9AFK5_9GAMM|nr:ABC transporter ATP-binding protein [Sinobacterium norvegicum]CAH0991527.1 putative ABC transporter ATP-binding protein NosF [Sinobacterium norvegicum]